MAKKVKKSAAGTTETPATTETPGTTGATEAAAGTDTAAATTEKHAHTHAEGETHTHDHGHDHAHDHDPKDDEGHGAQKVTVEDAGPARKRLTIEIPAERIATKLESGFDKLKSDAQIPGFRRGRAPLRLLQKRFGTSLRDDVQAQLLSECYTQAIEDEKLDVIGDPDVKEADKIKLPESGPLSFQVEVEVVPTFDLPALESIEVTKNKTEVTDANVDEEIEQLCERFGKMTTLTDAAVKRDDYVLADVRIFKGTLTAPPDAPADETDLIDHRADTYIHIPSKKTGPKGHVAGIIIEDLISHLVDKKVGEVVAIATTGPAGHENEKIRGQEITLIVRLDRVERLEPAKVEELPAAMSAENVDAVRERVKTMLQDRQERVQKAAMRDQVCNVLLEKAPFELPPGLSARQSLRVIQRQYMELAYRGVPQQEIEQRIAQARTESEEKARRQLKLFFILDAAAKKLDVDVSEAEVNNQVAMLAMQQGRRPEKLRQQMQRDGQLDQLYLQVRDQKTLDKILESAKITESDKPAPAA